MNESGERISSKERRKRILRAIAKMGGEATIQAISEETGLHPNGISQTLASNAIAEFAHRSYGVNPNGRQREAVYGKLTEAGRWAFGLPPEGKELKREPRPVLSPMKQELPPLKHGKDVLF